MMTEPEVLEYMRSTVRSAKNMKSRGILSENGRSHFIGQLWAMTIVVGTKEAFALNLELSAEIDSLVVRRPA